jgi:seryl-tRNA synthetase
VEVCKSLIPEAHNLTTILQQDGDSSEAILKMKSIIANLQMSKESLERELQKVRKEMAEMEEEHDEESKKLFDVSQAIATILPPTLRCKIADYCNKHIRKHKSYDKENEESEEDEDYDFSHSILLTDSNYDYKYEDYINKKNEK